VDNLTFGITMTIVGMGGTLVTLWILSILMVILKKIFPVPRDKTGDENIEPKGPST